MARVFTCGWESGYDSGLTGYRNEYNAGVNGNGGAIVGGGTCQVVANPGWWSSQGAYVMKMTGAACPGIYVPGDWSGVKFGFDALPGSDTIIIDDPGSGALFSIKLKTNGKLELWTGPTTSTLRATSTITLATQTTYLIEMKWVANTVVQVWVNGTLQMSTTTLDVAATAGMRRIGSQLASYVTYWDDFYANNTTNSCSSGQYGRRGWASVCPALAPNGDVGSAPGGSYANSAGLTWGNATTGWFSAIDDPPGAVSTTDYLSKTSLDANVIDISYADSPVGARANMVYVVYWVNNDGSGTGTIRHFPRYAGVSGGGSSTQTLAASATPQCFNGQQNQNEPNPSGTVAGGPSFTKATIDGFHSQWMESSAEDLTPPAQLLAAFLCYEQMDAFSAPSLMVQHGELVANDNGAAQTVVGLPTTPKALIWMAVDLSADGSASKDAMMFGVSAGSGKDAVISTGATDNVAAAATARRSSNTRSFQLVNGAGTTLGIAHMSAFNADGFTINWDTTASGRYISHYLALGGSAITNVTTGTFTPSGGTGNQSINGLGFRPDLVIMLTSMSTIGSSTGGSMNIGMMSSDSSQGAVAFRDRNAANPTAGGVYQRSDRCLIALADASDVVAIEASYTTMDTDGFTINHAIAGAAVDVHYLAIKFSGAAAHIGVETQKTSTGTKAKTGAGVTPVAMMTFGTERAASASPDYTQAKLQIGMADESRSAAIAIGMDDAVTPSNVLEWLYSNRSLISVDNAASVQAISDVYSFDADGFTMNSDVADATAREFLYLAFGTAGLTIFDSGTVTATISVSGVGVGGAGTVFDSGAVDVVTTQSATGTITGSAIDTGSAFVTIGVTGVGFAVGAPGTPSNLIAPLISGTPAVNRIVQCWPGAWTNDPTSFQFQWQRDVAGNGVFSNIGGATSHYYVLVAGDAANRVRCNVTPVNASGSGTLTSSNATRIVGAAPPGTVHEA